MYKNYELTTEELNLCDRLAKQWEDIQPDFENSLDIQPVNLANFKKLFADTCMLLQKYEEKNILPKAYVKFISEMYVLTASQNFYWKEERACQLLIEAVVNKLSNGEKLFENNVITAYAEIYGYDIDDKAEYHYNILEGDFSSLYAAMDYMQEKTGDMYYE